MVESENKPRPWDIYDLWDLGEKGPSPHMKAVPILLLEHWVNGERKDGVANLVRTESIASRLQESGLLGHIPPHGSGTILGGLRWMQNSRNLTDPPLLEYFKNSKRFLITLPHYESLLQRYRREYREEHPEAYKELYSGPSKEPVWGEPSSPPEEPVEQEESEPTPSVPQEQDEISNLLAPLARALRDRDQIIAGLTRDKQELNARIEEFAHVSEESHRERESLNTSRRVFVVHGHDTGLADSVALFLKRLELEPIILKEEPSGGSSTVIEKLEMYGAAAFAVVLLTPDDVGAVATSRENLQPRARQNVILELGYFMGRLGRKRTCALYAEHVEMPSDFKGVVYIESDKRGAWKSELAREMKVAGLPIDFNKVF